MIAYTDFVDLLLSKHKHNGAAVRRFLLVLGAPFDTRQLRGAASKYVAGCRPGVSN